MSRFLRAEVGAVVMFTNAGSWRHSRTGQGSTPCVFVESVHHGDGLADDRLQLEDVVLPDCPYAFRVIRAGLRHEPVDARLRESDLDHRYQAVHGRTVGQPDARAGELGESVGHHVVVADAQVDTLSEPQRL